MTRAAASSPPATLSLQAPDNFLPLDRSFIHSSICKILKSKFQSHVQDSFLVSHGILASGLFLVSPFPCISEDSWVLQASHKALTEHPSVKARIASCKDVVRKIIDTCLSETQKLHIGTTGHSQNLSRLCVRVSSARIRIHTHLPHRSLSLSKACVAICAVR